MANQLKPFEVQIKHPDEPRPLTTLRSAFDLGRYPGFVIVAEPEGSEPETPEEPKAASSKSTKSKAADAADSSGDAEETNTNKEG